MPTLNLGQVRPVYRGAWNSIDTYVAYDFVIYNGSAYLALKDVPANYEPPSQTEYWVLFGAKGEPGTPGEDGVDGAQGERGPSPAYRWDGTFLSIQNPDGTWPDQGIDLQGPAVPLSNSVTSTSETDAASSKAVKTAYDRGSSGIAAAETAQAAAETAQASVVTLRSDVPAIAAKAAAPSPKYIDYAAPGNGVSFVAPETGYMNIRMENAPCSIYAGAIGIAISPPYDGANAEGFIPVEKGENVVCYYSGSMTRFRFVYANGNAPA